MPDTPVLLESFDPPPSPAGPKGGDSRQFRAAAVQHRWHPDPTEHRRVLAEAAKIAAGRGAQLVCFQELTLHRYFAQSPVGPDAEIEPEPIPGGPSFEFASELAAELEVSILVSVYERDDELDARGYNTAIVVSPSGEIVLKTRKLHIPRTAGYHEDEYFVPGPADTEPFPTAELDQARVGCPTCWDQWFPETARAYGLQGAEVLVFPTAIGSEPEFPQFDTQPLWEKVMLGAAIANGLFVIAVNRVGVEDQIRFYGSSFISDPYGRMLVQAPRDRAAVLVADLELRQRQDWLSLFPFFQTRRPDAYGLLTATPELDALPEAGED